MIFPCSLHLFCRVVDNFGDIGVCWRLSRQLSSEFEIEVTLWVDDLLSFKKICAEIDPGQSLQRVQNIHVRQWDEQEEVVDAADSVGDIVIEAFGCHLPVAYVAAMAIRNPKPVWINLEYLSAESWVEGCHAMPSPHPSLPLIKYFFFPGFSNKTGGLLAEGDLIARRDAFQHNPEAVAVFLAGLGVSAAPGICRLSCFCYPSAPVKSLFDALQNGGEPVICLLPEGVAADAAGAFLQQTARQGLSATKGWLTVQVLPFLSHADYDKLLWACDMNFVRGEDSFTRAQWAARPFIWQIYPQEAGAHWPKLDAFLGIYLAGMAVNPAEAVMAAWHVWNHPDTRPEEFAVRWRRFRQVNAELLMHSAGWVQRLLENGDLASNLIQFVRKIS